MNTFARRVAAASLALGSLGFAVGIASEPAGAATRPAAVVKTAMRGTWHGTVDSVDKKMHKFTITCRNKKMYGVKYDAMTKWTMLKADELKKGRKVTVTGSLSKGTIKATKIS